jgi:phage FluMu protein Com
MRTTKNCQVLSDDKRCECGKLLFKKSAEGLEFKCGRCKRIHTISLKDHCFYDLRKSK